MRAAALPPCEVAVLLDVVHYVDTAAQEELLDRVRDALRPNGRLLLRVGDAGRRRRFAISRWVDHLVLLGRGCTAPLSARPLGDWMSALQRRGFEVHSVPMSRGTPFANVLLVADLGGARA
jgi:hypothetical protein